MVYDQTGGGDVERGWSKGLGNAPDERIGFQQVRQGRVYNATTDLVTVSGEYNFLFENPSGSGVNAFIDEVILYNDSSTTAAPLRANPDTNLPTTSTNPSNAKGGGPSPQCNFLADDMNNSLSGGTLTGDVLLSVTEMKENTVLKEVPEGQSLGSNTGYGDLSSPSAYLALRWYEYPTSV